MELVFKMNVRDGDKRFQACLVSQNQHLFTAVSALLSAQGCSVTLCSREQLKDLAELPGGADLILIDLTAETDPEQPVAQILSADMVDNPSAVIALSTYYQSGQWAAMVEAAGYTEVLALPLSPAVFSAKIKAILP